MNWRYFMKEIYLYCEKYDKWKSKEEFAKVMEGREYVCPITDDIPWPYKD